MSASTVSLQMTHPGGFQMMLDGVLQGTESFTGCQGSRLWGQSRIGGISSIVPFHSLKRSIQRLSILYMEILFEEWLPQIFKKDFFFFFGYLLPFERQNKTRAQREKRTGKGHRRGYRNLLNDGPEFQFAQALGPL